MNMSYSGAPVFFLVVFFSFSIFAQEEEVLSERKLHPTAQTLRGYVETYCAECHASVPIDGKPGQFKVGSRVSKTGNFLEHDVLKKFANTNSPSESNLFKQVESTDMPYFGATKYPEPQERAAMLEAIVAWQEAGAPSLNPPPPSDFISHDQIEEEVRSDLEDLSGDLKENARYISFANISNNPSLASKIRIYEDALNKLVNSLSWSPNLVNAVPINERRDIFRIDLRDYRWSESLWDSIEAVYPYSGLDFAGNLYLRGDWFISNASKPPLYHEILELPANLFELNAYLGIDIGKNIEEFYAKRAAFTESGPSENNRLIEYHQMRFGDYWISYDFIASTGKKNLMQFPLGPDAPVGVNEIDGLAVNSFEHDGGEVIFNLPNGLQAYYVTDSFGTRIDVAPVEVVSHPERPGRQVTNGISCMTCHSKGIIPQEDQVWPQITKLAQHFTSEEKELVGKLYGADPLDDEYVAGQERFLGALEKLNIEYISTPEPISFVEARYQETLSPATLASELAQTNEEFSQLQEALASSDDHEQLTQVILQTIPNPAFVGGYTPRAVVEFGFSEYLASTSIASQLSGGLSGPAGDIIGLYDDPRELVKMVQLILRERESLLRQN